jgi:hypothetical protein
MYSLAIERHEFWRLIAYGFLHADILHLTFNMLCLTLWGAHLEKRVGALYFILIYTAALITGAVVSNVTHSGPYLAVGASGAISGIMGALLCLWILAKSDLSVSFFVTNLGLNLVLALSTPNIDSGAHFGGFAAGVISCAVLDLIEKGNAIVFRCKFPEFIKVNLFLIIAVAAILVWGGKPIAWPPQLESWSPPLIFLIVCIAVIKLFDVILSIKRGLTVVVAALSVANAGLALWLSNTLVPRFSSDCASGTQTLNQIERVLTCADRNLMLSVVTAGAFVLTLLIHSQQFARGIKDVGFVGTSLRAERKRRFGI